MPVQRIEGVALNDVSFGDRDLLQVVVDLRRAEARITFSGAAQAVLSQSGGPTRVELERPVLVLNGVRCMATVPSTARPETIVLKWRLEQTSGGAVAEFLLVGDPEPVTLRFECEHLCLEA